MKLMNLITKEIERRKSFDNDLKKMGGNDNSSKLRIVKQRKLL